LTFGTLLNLTLFGGKVDSRGSVNSSGVYDMVLGNFNTNAAGFAAGLMDVDTMLGAELGFKLGDRGKLGVGYNFFDGPSTASGGGPQGVFNFNRLALMDADLDFNIASGLGLKAYYAKSDYYFNGHKQYDDHDWAIDGMLNYHRGALDAHAGWREVCPYFTAPGSWSRIGFINNPTDIKGFQVGLAYKFTEMVDAYASGEIYTGSDQKIAGTVIGLTNDDKINRIQAGVGFKFATNWHLGVGWEGVFTQVDAVGHGFGTLPSDKIDMNFYTAQLKYDLGKNTFWSFGYQIFNYENKTGLANFNIPGGPDNADGKAKSGLFFTQFQVKF